MIKIKETNNFYLESLTALESSVFMTYNLFNCYERSVVWYNLNSIENLSCLNYIYIYLQELHSMHNCSEVTYAFTLILFVY